MTKAAGAVKYTLGQAGIPAHLEKVAVVEVTTGNPLPPDTVEYSVTYYGSPDLIPASVKALAAHTYSLGQAIPAFLRRICTFIANLVPVPITDGKHLWFNDKTNSFHFITAGF